MVFSADGLVQFAKVFTHVFCSGLFSVLIYVGIKTFIRRKRPYDKYRFIKALVPPMDKFAFPSGHVMNNLVGALTLSLYVPWMGPWAWIVPISWGLLRVILGVHFPSDIIAGTILGFSVFELLKYVFAFFWPIFNL